MDIQGFIIDSWLSRLSDNHPILTVYDREGIYHDLLGRAEEMGMIIVDTTLQPMTAYEKMSKAWDAIKENPECRVLIYRNIQRPADDSSKRSDPYYSYAQTGEIFPEGPKDQLVHICHRFLPSKTNDIEALERNGSLTFENVNNLQEDSKYPILKGLTNGESLIEIVIGLLGLESVTSLNWLSEWRRLSNTHFPGLDTSGTPTLKVVQERMWKYLLFSEFVLDLPGELPDSLNTVPRAGDSQKTSIYDITKRIRNSVDMRDNYVEAAGKVASDLNLEFLFHNTADLGDIVTFAFENRVEYDRFAKHLELREIHEAEELCEKNKKGIWYTADKENKNFWDTAQAAVDIFKAVEKGMPSVQNRAELIYWYAQEGYKADLAMRRYLTLTKQSHYSQPQVVKITDLVDNTYRNFCDRIVNIYQNFTKENGFNSGEVPTNLGSFDRLILPLLNKKKRVAMIMADAFRYEMGVEFLSMVKPRFAKSECIASMAYLPTVTRFGMAALLPGAEHSLELQNEDGKLQPCINGKVIDTPEKRVALIKNSLGESVKVADTLLDNFNPQDISSDVQLLIIRSIKIDGSCESCDTQGLGSAEMEVRILLQRMEHLRNLGFDEAFIFADHGYMLQPCFKVGDKIEKPLGNDIILSERRCIAGNLNQSEDTIQFSPSEMGIAASFHKIAYAKGFGVFESGKAYFHEGLSLQENVVPIIHVILSKEKKEKRGATYRLEYKGQTSGTVRIQRPLIGVQANTTELFGEDLRVKMEIRNAAGAIAGMPVESDYYDENTGILSLPATELIKQPIELHDGLIGDIVITLLDPDSNVTLANLLLNTDLN